MNVTVSFISSDRGASAMDINIQDHVERPLARRPAAEARTPRSLPRPEQHSRPDLTPPAPRGRPGRAILAGLVLLAAIVTAGWLYWDNTSHFESTDDAFVASRQFAIAPKISGYITAVPVTDNQHVAAGDTIACI